MNRVRQDNRGYALITALIVTAVTAVLVLGYVTRVNTEQRIARNDTDYSKAFYAAEAGLEKLNSDLSKLFLASVFPSQADLAAIQGADFQPQISYATYANYSLTGGQATRLSGALNSTATTVSVLSTAGWPTRGFFMVDAEEFTYTGIAGNNFTGVARAQGGSVAAAHSNNAVVFRSQVVTLSEGANAGLNAQTIPFTLDVTAQVPVGAEARLTRVAQVALIPVFQFGIFSDSDLSFFAGPNFNFGGRVHSNGSIFLAEGDGNTLTLAQKVTAAGQIVRAFLANGWDTTDNYTGVVNVVTTPGNYRNLLVGEGSVVGDAASAPNDSWPGLSLTTYNGNILSAATGAKPLILPFVASGNSPIELIKRPAGEAADSLLGQSRLANQASIRVFISDNQANLPGGAGYALNNTNAGYVPIDDPGPPAVFRPPFAEANPNDPDFITVDGADETAAASLVDGFIYIERQNADNTWADVTMEILNLGISTSQPDAILQFQKPRWDRLDSTNSLTAADYVPINLYDAREARFRDDDSSVGTNLRKLGIMNVVNLNVNNLRRWFAGTIGTTGTNAVNNSGYIFYFSDRRGNRNDAGNETGELGFEDIVNAGDLEGDPNGGGTPETGEDLNGNTTLDTYGANLPYAPFTADTDLYATAVPTPVPSIAMSQTEDLDAAENGIDVSDATNITVPGYYRIENEIVNCTSKAGNTLTCSRGQLGTAAAAHNMNPAIDLAVSINNSSTSFTVSNVVNMTFPGYYRIESEIVLCTSAAGNVVTCERGMLGTTAAAHNRIRNWVTGNLTAVVTNINVVNAGAFPAPSFYRIDDETVNCTSKAGNVLTCIRGALGTAAVAHPLVSANLSANATAGTATLTFASTAVFAANPGILRIDSEVVNCTGKTATQLTGCARGLEGTTAAAHAIGAAVTTRMEIRLVNLLPANLFASERASKNRVHYFRRALRLVNGASPNLPTPGFSVTAENPVYVQGNYNSSNAATFTGAHSFAAVIGDAVTLLSNAWANGGDERSFTSPYVVDNRNGATTWYRMAIASGKGINFPRPTEEDDADFGTDGGTHNFLRYLEDWGGTTSNYRGSIVSLYFYRQAVGPYKCCNTVYSPPTRAYAFDTDFLVPSQLPPGTPRFRDINNLSFRQTIRADSD
jgi:Tfp pilus assembly protein PilX